MTCSRLQNMPSSDEESKRLPEQPNDPVVGSNQLPTKRLLRSPSDDTTHLTSPQTPAAERNILLKSSALYKIVLTGGPCGGKTTALARLSSFLRERGFEVLTVPEAFTIVASNGFSMDYFAAVEGMGACVQQTVMDIQMTLEDSFERILQARGKPSVLLCDRGLMDGSAYMTEEEWETLLTKKSIDSVTEIREGRYNAVFHMVTAAEGAEQYYTLVNNEVRTEAAEEARKLDVLTRTAWVGHPKLCVFDNSTDFEGKMQRLVDAAAKLVGLPSSLNRNTTKFLIRGVPRVENFPKDVCYNVFDVEKVYLYADMRKHGKGYGAKTSSLGFAEEYSFIRKRSHIGRNGKAGTTYGLTTVQIIHEGGQIIEVKRIITAREYASAYKTRDPSRHVIQQKRISFLWKMQSFNIHIYKVPVENLCILHAQFETKDGGAAAGQDVILPPFLDVERRIENTKEDNDRFGAFNISLISK